MYCCDDCRQSFEIPIKVICTWGLCDLCGTAALVNEEFMNSKQCQPCSKSDLIKINGWRGKQCYKCTKCGRIHPLKRIDPNDKQL